MHVALTGGRCAMLNRLIWPSLDLRVRMDSRIGPTGRAPTDHAAVFDGRAGVLNTGAQRDVPNKILLLQNYDIIFYIRL